MTRNTFECINLSILACGFRDVSVCMLYKNMKMSPKKHLIRIIKMFPLGGTFTINFVSQEKKNRKLKVMSSRIFARIYHLSDQIARRYNLLVKYRGR